MAILLLEQCYLCGNPLPEGQSFYADHGVRVCLECFKITPRCQKCRFPSNTLQLFAGIGAVCEFCIKELSPDDFMGCYLCKRIIPVNVPHYAGHGKTVCKACFKAAHQCFLCHFPHGVERVRGLGFICEFCQPTVLKAGDDLQPFIAPLQAFLQQYDHQITEPPQVKWVDWHILLGMQLSLSRPQYQIEFLDDYLHYCYPVWYVKQRFYVMPRISHPLFMAHMAGQLAAAHICQQYQLPHLLEENPFYRVARGWCHWIAYRTATALRYTEIQKQLARWPETSVPGEYKQFFSMAEFRQVSELKAHAQRTLQQHAQKYL